ncbi:efflux RND transporter periplasmic adaptor subunit [Roseobacter sinensis]|uniref:Efflux RND transporter periplasmic adaptor subunit n=1 Tax=Roseobacter sinensis TaxID=2931391 RepID=A0ABT3BJ97_9RHOB|nr:efflux RND transporter periplasmic adaptor subunit [Roseobacter sp. WL0113]MCV3273656.1 efflux RND transporter periplasmic adaptor subunit [Roseobacter sp. WL0113]
MRQAWSKIFLIAMAIAVALPTSAQQGAGEAEDAQALYVQTIVVPSRPQTVVRQFFGEVAARETVDLSFEVAGYLSFLEAREGTEVAKGTLLAELDLAPFERAVERAELSLAQAERDLQRAQTLAARNVNSDVQAENAETARDLADVALQEAREALADAQIHAPFDALVADRIGTAFTTVEPGQRILRLHNMSETRVEFDLPERLLATIDDPAKVRFEGRLAGRDEPIPLVFREFRVETGQVGQSYTMSLAATPSAGLSLLPGRTLVVRATLKQPPDGIPLPATAIVTRSDGTHAVIAVVPTDAGLRARSIPVDVESANGTEFIVKDLAPGTEIVAVGAHLIQDGQPLKRYAGLTVEGS